MPRTPSQADPRSVVAQSRLEEEPRLKTMWDGYAFAHDFREDCGHACMLDDQTYSERQQAVQQPGTCLYRHTSDRPFFFPPLRATPGGGAARPFILPICRSVEGNGGPH